MNIKRVIFLTDNLYRPTTANDQDPTFLNYCSFVDQEVFKGFKSFHLDLYEEYQRKFDTYLLSISSQYDLNVILEVGAEIESVIRSSTDSNNFCDSVEFTNIFDQSGALLDSLSQDTLDDLDLSLSEFSLTEILLQSLNSVFFAVGELSSLFESDEFDLADSEEYFDITNEKLHLFKSKCISEFMVQLDYNSNQYDTGSVDNHTEYLLRSGFIEFLYNRIINDLFEILFSMSDGGLIARQYIHSAFFAAILVLRTRFNLYAEYMSLLNHLIDSKGYGNFGNQGSYAVSSVYRKFNKLLGITTGAYESRDPNSQYYNFRKDEENSWDYKYDQYYNIDSQYDTLIIHNGFMTHKMLKYANMNSAVDYYIIKLENIRDNRFLNELPIVSYNPGDLLLNEFSRYPQISAHAHIDPKHLYSNQNILSFNDRYLAYYPFDIVIPYQILDGIYINLLRTYVFSSMIRSSLNYSNARNISSVGTSAIYSGCYIKGNNQNNLLSNKYRFNSVLLDSFDNYESLKIDLDKNHNIKSKKFMITGLTEAEIIVKCEEVGFINHHIFVDPIELGFNAFVPSTYFTLKETIENSGNIFGIILNHTSYLAEGLKTNPVFRVDLKHSKFLDLNTNFIVKFNIDSHMDYSAIYRNMLVWVSMIRNNKLNFVIGSLHNIMFYNVRLFIKNIAMRISEDVQMYQELPESLTIYDLSNTTEINNISDYDFISYSTTIHLNDCFNAGNADDYLDLPEGDFNSLIKLKHSLRKATITGFIYGNVSMNDTAEGSLLSNIDIIAIFPKYPGTTEANELNYATTSHSEIKVYYPGVEPSIDSDEYYSVLNIDIGDFDSEEIITAIDIFDTWGRFSHDNTDTQPANPSEVDAWVYDEDSGNIVCTVNSVSFIGFYSIDKLDVYALDTQLSSPNFDNDRLIFIIAFTIVDNVEYTLSAIRNTDDGNFTWRIVYNYLQHTAWIIADASPVIDLVSGWGDYPEGTRIKVIRDGDAISAITTQAGESEFVLSSLLEFNLNDDDRLTKFKGPQSTGYGCQSQNSTTIHDVSVGGITKEQKWYMQAILTNNYQIVDEGGQLLRPFNHNDSNNYAYDGLIIGGSINQIKHTPIDEIIRPSYSITDDAYLLADSTTSYYTDPSNNTTNIESYPNYLLAARSKLFLDTRVIIYKAETLEHLWGDAIWPFYTQYTQ